MASSSDALGGDGLAPQRLGHLEVEVDLLVGLAEGELVDVDVDAGVVVHLADLLALGQLRLPQLGAVGVVRRLAGVAPSLPPPMPAKERIGPSISSVSLSPSLSRQSRVYSAVLTPPR